MGRVTGSHGLRGMLKVHSFAESIDLYREGEPILIALPDGSVETLTLGSISPHGRGLLMHLAAVDDRQRADRLAGAALFVDKARLPALEKDTYYWFELKGLRVCTTAGTWLGVLEEVIPTPANDVYVVRGETAGRLREVLIPAVGSVVVAVDLEQGTMVVDPPDGL